MHVEYQIIWWTSLGTCRSSLLQFPPCKCWSVTVTADFGTFIVWFVCLVAGNRWRTNTSGSIAMPYLSCRCSKGTSNTVQWKAFTFKWSWRVNLQRISQEIGNYLVTIHPKIMEIQQKQTPWFSPETSEYLPQHISKRISTPHKMWGVAAGPCTTGPGASSPSTRPMVADLCH